MLNQPDLTHLREATSAYYRAAALFAETSLLLRQAAKGIGVDSNSLLDGLAEIRPAGDNEPGADFDSDREFLLDRAAIYRDKAALMTDSATALLGHLSDWFDDHPDEEGDSHADAQSLEDMLSLYMRALEGAADEHERISAALRTTPLTEREDYRVLLDDLGTAIRFLASESALFSSFLNDDVG